MRMPLLDSVQIVRMRGKVVFFISAIWISFNWFRAFWTSDKLDSFETNLNLAGFVLGRKGWPKHPDYLFL